jgi:hypothetical protein
MSYYFERPIQKPINKFAPYFIKISIKRIRKETQIKFYKVTGTEVLVGKFNLSLGQNTTDH